MGRYGKASQGTIRSGYNPPVYGGDYNYNNRNAEDGNKLISICIHKNLFLFFDLSLKKHTYQT